LNFAATDERSGSAEVLPKYASVVPVAYRWRQRFSIAFNKPGWQPQAHQKQVADVFLGVITDWKQT